MAPHGEFARHWEVKGPPRGCAGGNKGPTQRVGRRQKAHEPAQVTTRGKTTLDKQNLKWYLK